MTTIYMKSKDGQTVGAVEVKPRRTRPFIASMESLGYTAISEVEYRALKAQMLRRMIQPAPEPVRV